MNKQIIVLFLLSLLFTTAYSQSFTNSPYSYYGLGELEPSDYGRTSGMGGVGIGITSNQFLNRANPASLSRIDTLSFMFEVALSGKFATYKTNSDKVSVFNSGLKKLAIGFRINKYVATSIGIGPYSNVGYKITTTKLIGGTSSQYYTTDLTGDGGLSQFYWANSLRINDKISLGVDASYIFGSITKDEKVTSPVFESYYSLNKKYTPNRIYFDFGAQYQNNYNDIYYVVGLTGGFKRSLLTQEYISEQSITLSTTSDVPTSVFDQSIPAFWGVGSSVRYRSWMFAADYKVQYWGNLVNHDGQHIFSNSKKLAFGTEYIPGVSVPKYFYQRMVYQAGFHYDESYIKIDGVNLNGYGFTIGAGIPGRRERSLMGFSFEVGKRGSLSNGLIRETYYQVNVNLSLNDIWFVRPKYQ